MLKNLFNILILFFPFLLIAQSEIFMPSLAYKHPNSSRIVAFQKQIIKDKISASNQALVFKDGKIIYHHIENSMKTGDKEITDKTIFPIWSMSKPITIVAIMILFEKGLLDFDDPVSKYIPAFSHPICEDEKGTYPCKSEVKLIDLMSHRSGYVTYKSYYIDVIKSENLEELMNKIANQRAGIEPGSKFLYGIDQSILGRVIEVVSGKSFYDFLKENLFDPLEMKNTKFYLTEKELDNVPPLFVKNNLVEGFLTDGVISKADILTYYKNHLTHLGGEGLVSTISDYFNFCMMLLNNGSFNEKRIISPESIQLITQKYSEGYPIEKNAFKDLLGFYYGLTVWVLEDSSILNLHAPEGIFGKGGYHGTEFWIDQKNSMFGIFMTRALSNPEFRDGFIRSVYKDFPQF